MALTKDEAIEFLDTYGLVVPDVVLNAVLVLSAGRSECLEANYSPEVGTLIQAYLFMLMSVAQGGRMISSQRGVSGASQSFVYRTLAELWRGLEGLLRALDTKGCVTDLIPENPSEQNHVGLWVGKGGCMSGRRP